MRRLQAIGEGRVIAKHKKRSDGRYEARVNVGIATDGRYTRKAVYARTLAELGEKIRDAKNQAELGVDIVANKPTVKAWAGKWLEAYKPDIKRSMRSVYAGMINKWLLPLHALKIDKVRQVQLQEILRTASMELSQSSIDKLYNCMRGIFSSARRNGLTAVDVSEFLNKPTGGSKAKREALTEEEQTIMARACARDAEGALPMIIMYAGLRIGEALALTWEDIRDGHIHVSKTIAYEENSNKPTIKNAPKTDAGVRAVPILAPLWPFLERLPQDASAERFPTSPLFSSGGRLYSNTMKRHLWARLMSFYEEEWAQAHPAERGDTPCDLLRPPRAITSHMLRHTYITILYDAGIDIKTAQKWAGHATVSVLMDTYTHLSEGKETEAARKLERFISGRKSDDIFDDTDDKMTTKRVTK